MQFLSAEPQLFVADMTRSLAFYCEKLGFELALSYGDPLFYAQVARGGAALNLRSVTGPVFDASFRARSRSARRDDHARRSRCAVCSLSRRACPLSPAVAQ